MTYKVKSLIYFAVFMMAILWYNAVEEEQSQDKSLVENVQATDGVQASLYTE